MLSKTAAIKKARGYVSMPMGRRTSWQVIGPYYFNKLNGPSTTINFDSYQKAILCRARWVAEIALELMGKEGVCMEVYHSEYWENDVVSLVNRALRDIDG